MNETIEKLERALTTRQRYRLDSTRRAAVTVLLHPVAPDTTQLLLIERTRRPDDPWSGHMAFPGGRIEPEDETALDAAYREAQEEVGLDLTRQARQLGVSDDIRAMAKGQRLDLVITPFVFALTDEIDESDLSLQNDEVADVLWAPFEEMAAGKLDGTFMTNRPNMGTVKLPCFEVDGKVIWGLTYMMLRNLLDILKRSTSYESRGEEK